VAAIDLLGTPRCVLAVAVLFALAGGLAAPAGARGLRALNVALAAAIALAAAPLADALPFRPSRDKDIYRFLEDGAVYYTRWSSIFRTDMIGAKGRDMTAGGYRGGEGLGRGGTSTTYEGVSPPYRYIVHDGGAAAILYKVSDGLHDFGLFRHHVLTTPYVVRERPAVLVIGVGGGADVINALVNGAAHVTGVELDPDTVDLLVRRFRDYTGGLYERPDVELHASEGRHFVRSSGARFDLIQITGVDTLAALSSGAYVLAENYLYSVEAYHDYFGALNPDGILSIGTFDVHPQRGFPRHVVRFAAVAEQALRERGAARPADHLAIVSEGRSGHVEVLTKLSPFTAAELDALERFVEENRFQSWYLPGRPARQLPLFRSLLESDAQGRERFFEQQFLNVRATRDDQPFFFSYYKWGRLLEHRDEIDPGHTLATGQLVLALLLGLGIVFSAVAILLPLVRVRAGAAGMPGRFGFLAYFAALGAGFILAEISFVQRFILFLGYPTYSLTVTLFSLLTSAGAGAWLSGRLPDDPRRALPALTLALTALVGLYALALPALFAALLAAPLALRIAVSVAAIAPLGLLLGMYFPYGIRLTSAWNRDFVAWAWAVNGCLTVVGSVASIILAMTFGFRTVIVLFVVIYWLGAASFTATWRRVAAPSTRT
jgi:predicted membrane-bound spermidine synthase